MGRIINFHLVYEEGTEGQPRGELYKQARKRLEKRLMINYSEGNISFTPLVIKEMDADGKEKEICDAMERVAYRRGSEERGFKVTDRGLRFPKR